MITVWIEYKKQKIKSFLRNPCIHIENLTKSNRANLMHHWKFNIPINPFKNNRKEAFNFDFGIWNNLSFSSTNQQVALFCCRSVFSTPKSIQATVTLLENLHIILEKTPRDDIRTEVLPMLYSAFESTTIQVQVKMFYITYNGIIFLYCF